LAAVKLRKSFAPLGVVKENPFLSENETLAVNFQIDSPEIEVSLLGTQDKYIALLEEGMNV